MLHALSFLQYFKLFYELGRSTCYYYSGRFINKSTKQHITRYEHKVLVYFYTFNTFCNALKYSLSLVTFSRKNINFICICIFIDMILYLLKLSHADLCNAT